jgi:gliding motility-associated-like protein
MPSICTFAVTVKDVTAPVITGPLTIVEVAGTSCSKSVNFPLPKVQDCSSVNIVSTHNPGDNFSIGVTEVSYTATDLIGNATTYKFNVTIEDKSAPVFQNCPGNIVVNANSACSAIVNWDKPHTTDNCGDLTVTSTHNPGMSFVIGNTEVIYTATDAYGNISSCTFIVIVTSDLKPTISNCPNDIHLEGDDENRARVDWQIPTATAQCGNVIIKGSHSPRDIFNVGTTTVEYQATDDTGNITYCQFNVVVSPIEMDIDISKAITPDGDGKNDAWILGNIQKFKDNKVVVVDRWGGIIFIDRGYNNESIVWQGKNRAGELVSTGTYFYTISVRAGTRNVNKSGSIEVVR